MLVLVLQRILASRNRVVTAHRGALQRVDIVLRSLPCFVTLEILGHVVEIVLFLGRRSRMSLASSIRVRARWINSRRASFMSAPLPPVGVCSVRQPLAVYWRIRQMRTEKVGSTIIRRERCR